MLAGSIGSEDDMRRAAQAVTIGFAALMVFEAGLAVGAPLGDAAWGGAHTHLTTGQRIGSAISVCFYLAAILVVRGRAAGREERRYRWSIWALAVVLGASDEQRQRASSRTMRSHADASRLAGSIRGVGDVRRESSIGASGVAGRT